MILARLFISETHIFKILYAFYVYSPFCRRVNKRTIQVFHAQNIDFKTQQFNINAKKSTTPA